MIWKNITQHPDVCFSTFLRALWTTEGIPRPLLSRLLRPGANAIVHRVELEAVEKEPQVVDGNLKKLRGSEFRWDDLAGWVGK
jgi:hypothetical protein